MDFNTIFNGATGAGTVGTLIIALWMMNKKNKTQVKLEPQPIEVQITKDLKEQFAGRKEFIDHVQNNTQRHNQIFHKIDAATAEMRTRDEAITKDLNEKFLSIQRLLGRIEQKIESHSR